jgi:hypothetical protein
MLAMRARTDGHHHQPAFRPTQRPDASRSRRRRRSVAPLTDRLPPVRIGSDNADVTVIFEIEEEGGETVCGLYRLDGRINLPPRAWLRLVRAEIEKLERIARDAGCTEMRVAGRDWSRVLPDYERIPGGSPNLLRKRLI